MVLNTFHFINAINALIWVTFALLFLKQQGLFSARTYGNSRSLCEKFTMGRRGILDCLLV